VWRPLCVDPSVFVYFGCSDIFVCNVSCWSCCYLCIDKCFQLL